MSPLRMFMFWKQSTREGVMPVFEGAGRRRGWLLVAIVKVIGSQGSLTKWEQSAR